MKYLKLYGLQRSGTNYLKWILEQNFNVFVLQNFRGWKHGEVLFLSKDEDYNRDLSVSTLNPEQKSEIKNQDVPRIAIKKDIHAWLVSYYKYKGFRWGVDYKRLIDHYFQMNEHYEQHCFMVEYEQLLEMPEVYLYALMKIHDLSMRHDKFILSADKVMPRGGDDHSDSWALKYRNKDFNAGYYLNKEYLKEIPNLLEINAYLESIQRK